MLNLYHELNAIFEKAVRQAAAEIGYDVSDGAVFGGVMDQIDLDIQQEAKPETLDEYFVQLNTAVARWQENTKANFGEDCGDAV